MKRLGAVKTRPGICNRKRRFVTREAAEAVALSADVPLRAYKCALCRQFHLTGRTKGLRVPRGDDANTDRIHRID